ncbi:MAG: hypothetical protein H7289_07900 [Mucilaginibacter sp.]|nr:hypothetical protein [Mucilaginibacter sp.]
MQALCFPLIQVYNQFTDNRISNLYKLSHNGQVFSLENALNDRFDNVLRRIYISDGFTKDRIYIFTPEELKPKFLGTLSIFNKDDYADTGVDFIVWIPAGITGQGLIEIKALIDFYKIAAKRFRIYNI